MHPYLHKFFRINWLLFLLMLAMMCFGIFAIYSATWMRENIFWRDQIKWSCICLPLFFCVALVDYRWIRWGAIPLYALGILTLIATVFIGTKTYGARSWLNLGFMSFQPSQLSVLSGILTLALFLSRYPHWAPLLKIATCGLLVGVPWILILIQPDLGAVLVWIPILLGMLFVSGIPVRYLTSLMLLGIAAVPVVVNFGLKPYQKDRILVFLNPNLDPQGAGWTINQSMIAIGSGGIFGKGFKAPNTLNELGFLPSTIVHNDFIFSVIGEQHGFVGGLLLLSAFALVFIISAYIVVKAGDELGRLVGTGIIMLLFAHTFMNIGMTIQVTPITGLPLPLISYGGSFLLITLISFGFLQSIWIHRNPDIMKMS